MGWISGLPRFVALAAVLAASLAVAAVAAPPAVKSGAPAGAKPAATASRGAKAAAGSPAATSASKSKPANGGTKVTPKSKPKPKQKPGEVLEIDWSDLLPENERAHYSASAPPPEHGPLGEGGPPAVQKQTTTFNEELADMVVRMPGFIVPIGAPRGGLITEFFLVPYIGACIHVPPPPPNQMVYVTVANGIAADAIHDAYWVTGKIRVESRTTELGTAAYALEASGVERYEY
jgi:hypothetical protein